MSKHTPEPWIWEWDGDEARLIGVLGEWRKCDRYCYGWTAASLCNRGEPGKPGHEHRDCVVIADATWHNDGTAGLYIKREDASRIVSCVNALAGIDDPAAFVERAKRMEEALRECARADSDCGEAARELARSALNPGGAA